MFIFTNFEVKRELWTKDRIKLINIKTGHITSLKEQEELVDEEMLFDDEEEIDYKSKYYELQN